MGATLSVGALVKKQMCSQENAYHIRIYEYIYTSKYMYTY